MIEIKKLKSVVGPSFLQLVQVQKPSSPAQISSSPSPALSSTKTNITKTSQSLPYQKRNQNQIQKYLSSLKKKTRNIIT